MLEAFLKPDYLSSELRYSRVRLILEHIIEINFLKKEIHLNRNGLCFYVCLICLKLQVLCLSSNKEGRAEGRTDLDARLK